MNIVILAGGTGSIALQTGLYEILDKTLDGVDTKVLVNAYDNGLSTGAVRKICDGKILGPSDVRKNQTTRLKLENPTSPWLEFLDVRFTIESSKVKDFCLSKLKILVDKLGHDKDGLSSVEDAIDVYFSIPTSLNIDYTDFSLANIVYAGFAKLNNNSLRAAAREMAKLMGIKDNVILNDDTSLFLGAVTKNGIKISDEGDIVSWGNVDDPFVDLFFIDPTGNETKPALSMEASDAIINADLVILSSGTQWSSLIPTYASIGFKECMSRSQAKIVMVMNKMPDKDSPGQTASDIIKLLVPRFFDKKRINLVVDTGGHDLMTHVDSEASSLLASVTTFNTREDAGKSTPKHNPLNLVNAVGRAYFSDYINSEYYMFDYDDTLVGRGNHQCKSSEFNKASIATLNSLAQENVSICTGNSIKAISLKNPDFHLYRSSGGQLDSKPVKVFADGGVNLYSYDFRKIDSNDEEKPDFIKCINETCVIGSGESGISSIVNILQENGIPYSKIENRGNTMVCIRPIHNEYRLITLNLVKHLLKNFGLTVQLAGRSTIEIFKPTLSKQDAVNYVLNNGIKSLTYVGDELLDGNDSVVAQLSDTRIKCLNVKDPAETAFFLKVLLSKYNNV